MDQSSKEFRQKIKKLIEEKGHCLEDLAEDLGIQINSLKHFLLGHVRSRRLERICNERYIKGNYSYNEPKISIHMSIEERQKMKELIKEKGHKISDIANDLLMRPDSLQLWFAGKMNSSRIERVLIERYINGNYSFNEAPAANSKNVLNYLTTCPNCFEKYHLAELCGPIVNDNAGKEKKEVVNLIFNFLGSKITCPKCNQFHMFKSKYPFEIMSKLIFMKLSRSKQC